MKRPMLVMLAIVLVIVSLLGFVKFQQIQAAMAGGAFVMPPEPVTTVVVQPQPWQSAIEATGTVVPAQGVTLSADLPGVVSRIGFESGARVSAGAVLVELDSRQERAQLQAAEAQRELAAARLRRSKLLLEQQLISQAEFDEVTATAEAAEASASAIRAVVERKQIRAPFAGHTGIRMVNLGQYVNSGDPIVPLQARERVFVNFSVPQQQVPFLKVGAEVLASADTSAAATVRGRITAIDPVIDEATRNVRIQATMENPRDALRAGAYVNVRVLTGNGARHLAVPASAVNYAPYGNSVFVVEKMKGPDGKEYVGARQQFVQLGPAQGDQVAVLSGLKPGEEVVSSGVFKLRPNASVKVDNSVQPSNNPAPKPQDS